MQIDHTIAWLAASTTTPAPRQSERTPSGRLFACAQRLTLIAFEARSTVSHIMINVVTVSPVKEEG